MNAIATKVRDSVLKGIRKVSPETIIYRRMFEGVYDDNTRQTVAPEPQEYSIHAMRDASSLQTVGSSFGSGSTVEVGDVFVSVPAVQFDSFKPSTGDELVFDGKTWVIKGIQSEDVGFEPYMWILQVRHS